MHRWRDNLLVGNCQELDVSLVEQNDAIARAKVRVLSATDDMESEMPECSFELRQIAARNDDVVNAYRHTWPPVTARDRSGGNSLQPEFLGCAIHRRDHEPDMLVEVHAQFFGALDNVVTIDAPCERFVFHLLAH